MPPVRSPLRLASLKRHWLTPGRRLSTGKVCPVPHANTRPHGFSQMWLFHPDSPFWKLVGYTRFYPLLADVARNGIANLIPKPTKAK